MSDRAAREARALEIVKAIRPGQPNLMVVPSKRPDLVRAPPPNPDPTFTLFGFPEGTEYPANIVYFMYSAGRIKIGQAGTVRSRHRGLRNAGAFPPVVLLVLKGGEPMERKLHKQFAKDRLHGEWFAVSKEIRTFLRQRLCDVGRASFEKAESDFRDYCVNFIAAHKPLERPLALPPEEKPKPRCPHGRLLSLPCYSCERERDLKIMEQIQAGTYVR